MKGSVTKVLSVRTFANRIGVTEATIRTKLKSMSNLRKDQSGRYILSEEIYSQFLYKFYTRLYAKDSHSKVFVQQKGHTMLSKGKINKVTKKSNGKTYYYLSQFPIGYDVNGEVIYRNSKGLPSRAECEALRQQWITEREAPKYNPMSFYNYCKNLYENDKTLAESTKYFHLKVINKHLKDYFSDVPYNEITSKILNDYTEHHLKSSIWGVRVVITKALHELYRTEVIERDLSQLVKYPKEHHRAKKKPLSSQNVKLVFQYFKWHRLEHAIQLLFKTGVRAGELLALHWDDIELLDDNLIVTHVSKSIAITDAGYIVKEPKNRSSIREVYTYDEELWQLLKTSKDNSKTKWVVPNRSNTSYLQYNSLTRFMREAGETIGLPERLTPHVARHTYISSCLHNGINAEYIAPQVGHTDTTMIYKVYGKATEKIKDIFKNVSNY